jgi:Family of unknown function (DUF5519)
MMLSKEKTSCSTLRLFTCYFILNSTMSVHSLIQQIEQNVLLFNGVIAIPHPRFGGRQFEWNDKEIGHIHWNGDLDILFKKEIHNVLVEEAQGFEHKWVPGAGWITFPVLKKEDINHALTLLQFSYYQKRKRAEREKDFSTAIEALELSSKIKALI